jgi:hypothetical protein
MTMEKQIVGASTLDGRAYPPRLGGAVGATTGERRLPPPILPEAPAGVACPLCALRAQVLDLCGDQLLTLWERRDSAHGADEEA